MFLRIKTLLCHFGSSVSVWKRKGTEIYKKMTIEFLIIRKLQLHCYYTIGTSTKKVKYLIKLDCLYLFFCIFANITNKVELIIQ